MNEPDSEQMLFDIQTETFSPSSLRKQGNRCICAAVFLLMYRKNIKNRKAIDNAFTKIYNEYTCKKEVFFQS